MTPDTPPEVPVGAPSMAPSSVTASDFGTNDTGFVSPTAAAPLGSLPESGSTSSGHAFGEIVLTGALGGIAARDSGEASTGDSNGSPPVGGTLAQRLAQAKEDQGVASAASCCRAPCHVLSTSALAAVIISALLLALGA
jgi:hypothetical protein